MPVTEADVKAQIILEVGDVDPATGDPPTDPATGVVALRIDYLWERYAGWDGVAAGLRELFCREAAIRLVLGVLKPRRFDFFDTRASLRVFAHQIVDSYEAMLADVGKEIERARARARASSAGAGGYAGARLVHTAPVEAQHAPDPNALRYGGTVREVGIIPPDDDVTSI